MVYADARVKLGHDGNEGGAAPNSMFKVPVSVLSSARVSLAPRVPGLLGCHKI